MNNHAREFMKRMEGLGRQHDRHRVFLDWLTAASSCLLVRSSPWHREQGEKDYMAAVKGYSREDLSGFSELLGIATLALEDEFQDFLGHCFMSMEMGNKHQGQFFTPYPLSVLCAQMTLGTPDPGKEFWTIQEPACGSGGMLIAMMEVFRSHGINYQTQTYSLAVDVSEMAARMAYIQLSILGVPAKVVLGNTLSMETRAVWPTLFYGRVCHKLKPGATPWTSRDPADASPPSVVPDPPPERREILPMPEQLSFF